LQLIICAASANKSTCAAARARRGSTKLTIMSLMMFNERVCCLAGNSRRVHAFIRFFFLKLTPFFINKLSLGGAEMRGRGKLVRMTFTFGAPTMVVGHRAHTQGNWPAHHFSHINAEKFALCVTCRELSFFPKLH